MVKQNASVKYHSRLASAESKETCNLQKITLTLAQSKHFDKGMSSKASKLAYSRSGRLFNKET